MVNFLKIIVITCLVILVCGFTTGTAWWFFVIPVFIWGTIIRLLQWEQPVFLPGFISGCLIWSGVNLYFNSSYNNVLHKAGLLLAMPTVVIFICAGIIGGLLTALALYSGNRLLSGHPQSSAKEY